MKIAKTSLDARPAKPGAGRRTAKPAEKSPPASSPRARKSQSAAIHPDIRRYHASLSAGDKRICDLLAQTITRCLPGAENKVWHAHPVWFLDGNPIVGYSRQKDCVRLLFWSGQSFDEPDLAPEGSFKAAEARYTAASQVSLVDLERWLEKSARIQWDYKNIVKRQGKLKRLV